MRERTLGLRIVTVVLGGVLCAAPALGEDYPYLTVEVEGAGPSTLYATDDSFFRENEPDTNYDNRTNLNVRSWDGEGGSDHWDCDTLIKFDLSSISPGSEITSATLHLFYEAYQQSKPVNRWHTCYRITDDWDENELTYNNRPGHAITETTTVLFPSDPGVWVTFDVTSDVQLYADGSDHYGWQISDDGTWNASNIPDPWYSSRESPTMVCGDAQITDSEECDDGDTDPGDGCSSTCTVEDGWACSEEPSVCAFTCGDGDIDTGEECDDDDTDPGDGCSSTCMVEDGWECSGEPSVCTFTCGDGVIDTHEDCDDGGTMPGDGCDASCQIESGWTCAGEPSDCSVCGDGGIGGTEQCDDGGTTPGDGCDASCQVEWGWTCVGEPSICDELSPICIEGVCHDGVWNEEFCGRDAYVLTGSADMNHDCVVDDLDDTLLQEQWGMVGPNLSGDLDADGTVSISDYLILAATVGPVSPCIPCASPVPALSGYRLGVLAIIMMVIAAIILSGRMSRISG